MIIFKTCANALYQWLWRTLRKIEFLRSALYFVIELRQAFLETNLCDRAAVDRPFRLKTDPWNYYTNPVEQERFRRQTEILDTVRGQKCFRNALEIGCAEGVFTEILAQRSDKLLVLDISSTALARARARCCWDNRVDFRQWDLRHDLLKGAFDLIVVSGILEYFKRPDTFRRVRAKLVKNLAPDGYLLVENTRVNKVIENSRWARWLIREKWINAFFAQAPGLKTVSSIDYDTYVITLLQKKSPRPALRGTVHV